MAEENTSQDNEVLDVSVLASSLARAASTLWSVDGEDRLADQVSFPAPAEEVADALRRLGGRVRVFAPAEAIAAWRRSGEIDRLVLDSDGVRVLLLAWDDEGEEERPSWALVRDLVAERALRLATGT